MYIYIYTISNEREVCTFVRVGVYVVHSYGYIMWFINN